MHPKLFGRKIVMRPCRESAVDNSLMNNPWPQKSDVRPWKPKVGSLQEWGWPLSSAPLHLNEETSNKTSVREKSGLSNLSPCYTQTAARVKGNILQKWKGLIFPRFRKSEQSNQAGAALADIFQFLCYVHTLQRCCALCKQGPTCPWALSDIQPCFDAIVEGEGQGKLLSFPSKLSR